MKYGHYEYKEAEKFLIKIPIAGEVIKHSDDATNTNYAKIVSKLMN